MRVPLSFVPMVTVHSKVDEISDVISDLSVLRLTVVADGAEPVPLLFDMAVLLV